MSWLRIDDAFTSNKKIVQLTDSQFRVWMRTLCWCSAADDPTVDKHTMREVRGLKRASKLFQKMGLLDLVCSDTWVIHDWEQYRPKDATGALRQAKWRANHVVTNTVTPTVTESVTETVSPVPVPVIKPLVLASTSEFRSAEELVERAKSALRSAS